ncbi:hypothetical protein NDU88_001571 [Pleurodeles waltl]|uniref:Uncharacterized protein n=1 Tax=Pleurodeles waltl TaxID=8319 RepID=A0AAV7LZY4_PLEWA|nr:hypothetical protein NDU88_001571 [Pleurodeles waltl]
MESGTESRFSVPCDALFGRHDNMDAACLTGILDIRVPETLKEDDGLCTRRVSEERNAAGDAGGDAEKEKRKHGDTRRDSATEELRTSSFQDRTETDEVSEGRDLRHVPGGTWLNQGIAQQLRQEFHEEEEEKLAQLQRQDLLVGGRTSELLELDVTWRKSGTDSTKIH